MSIALHEERSLDLLPTVLGDDSLGPESVDELGCLSLHLLQQLLVHEHGVHGEVPDVPVVRRRQDADVQGLDGDGRRRDWCHVAAAGSWAVEQQDS